MRIVVVVDAFGPALPAPAAVAAISAGWRTAAPDDQLIVPGRRAPAPDSGAPGSGDPGGGDLGAALDRADLTVVGTACFDWSSLRDSLVTAVAGAALERGVPCVVVAGAVSVGRREAASIGVDAAYAVEDPAGPHADTLAALAERVARRWSRRSPTGGA